MIRARATWLRYVAASAGALAVDLGCFALLLRGGAPAAVAAGVGYGAGIPAHWFLSSRAVFADRLAATGAPRLGQQARFVASAGAGTAVTTGVVGLGAALGLAPWAAKGCAILASFQTMWLIRRHLVFAA